MLPLLLIGVLSSAQVDVGPEAAVRVIRSYYDAINRHDSKRAYRYWSGEGKASGQNFGQFKKGFARTASVEVRIGTPGRIEGAAGSRYVEIPVEVTAKTTSGETEHFRGKYVLRRSEVDGATAEQRQWRIASARLSRMTKGGEARVTLDLQRTSATTILLTLRNGSSEPVGYNLCSSALERRSGGTWQPIPTDEMCTMDIRSLPPGQSTTFEKRLPPGLPSGEYRYLARVEIGDKQVPIESAAFTVR